MGKIQHKVALLTGGEAIYFTSIIPDLVDYIMEKIGVYIIDSIPLCNNENALKKDKKSRNMASFFRDFPAFQNLGPGALDFGKK